MELAAMERARSATHNSRTISKSFDEVPHLLSPFSRLSIEILLKNSEKPYHVLFSPFYVSFTPDGIKYFSFFAQKRGWGGKKYIMYNYPPHGK